MRGRRIENVPEDREAAAVYIADLAADLARMARRQGLDTLGYKRETQPVSIRAVTRN
jgi:hypothetical protein